jgi:hypothetical protein
MSAQENQLRFRWTPEQLALLETVLNAELKKQLQVRFENLSDDEKNIRRITYLTGGVDMLEYLLDFDQMLDQAAEDEKQKLLDNTSASTSTTSTF